MTDAVKQMIGKVYVKESIKSALLHLYLHDIRFTFNGDIDRTMCNVTTENAILTSFVGVAVDDPANKTVYKVDEVEKITVKQCIIEGVYHPIAYIE